MAFAVTRAKDWEQCVYENYPLRIGLWAVNAKEGESGYHEGDTNGCNHDNKKGFGSISIVITNAREKNRDPDSKKLNPSQMQPSTREHKK